MTEAGMAYVDALRARRASADRFSETLIEIDQVVALLREAADVLLIEGDLVRALARVREAAAVMGCATLH